MNRVGVLSPLLLVVLLLLLPRPTTPFSWPEGPEKDEAVTPPNKPNLKDTFRNHLPLGSSPRTRILDDRCPSINDKPCSGRGNCTAKAASILGVAMKESQSSKYCTCRSGWFGTACHMNKDEFERRKKLRDQLVRLFSAPTAVGSVAGKYSHDLRESDTSASVFSRQFANAKPVPYTKSRGEIVDESGPVVRDEPHPHSFDAGRSRTAPRVSSEQLRDWATPPQREFYSGAAAYGLAERERKEPRVVVKPPAKRSRFDTLATEAKLALYTDASGRSIVAPLVYEGQKGFSVSPNHPPPADPTVQKLVDTLNAMADRKDASGQPLKTNHD